MGNMFQTTKQYMVPSGNLTQTMERSTMLLMGKLSVWTGTCSIAIKPITREYIAVIAANKLLNSVVHIGKKVLEVT